MRVDKIKQEISQLALSEQLLLVESVWDAIAESNADIPMPLWQKQELDNRYKAYKEGKLALHDWQSVHQTLRKDDK